MSLKYSRIGSRQRPSDISRLMTTALERPEVLSLAAGFTDNESLPLTEVARIVEELAVAGSAEKTVLQYGTNQGRPKLREAICRRVERQDGLPAGTYEASDCFITNGSQQALYLAIQTLCDEGDIVYVEQPTYFVFLEILDGLGIEARPIPASDDGSIELEGFEEDLKAVDREGKLGQVKAVYLVSYFANPSGRCVDEISKKGVGRIVSRIDPGIAIIEDAAYRELYFENEYEAKGCMRYDECKSLSVLYTSTLTKPFATGLKVGYGYCTDADWLGRMQAVKGQHDFGTSHFTQAVMERAIEGATFDGHLGLLRKLYSKKMLVLDEVLSEGLRNLGWDWQRPEGGLYLWMQAPGGLDTDFESDFYADCVSEGVMYVPGYLCHGRREPNDCVRLSFGVLGESDLHRASERFLKSCMKFG